MRYIPNTEADRRQMLDAIGVGAIGELFTDIPEALRLKRPLKIPPALAETDAVKRLRALAARNADTERYNSFLGAGCY
ncbi:MAG: gcvPA, partial [candidate division NC10 bacterium]|nr:gcvPA [candidate division NC10 bacterium]